MVLTVEITPEYESKGWRALIRNPIHILDVDGVDEEDAYRRAKVAALDFLALLLAKGWLAEKKLTPADLDTIEFRKVRG